MTLSQLTLLEATIDTVVRGGWVMVPIFFVGWWAWLLLMERAYQIWWLRGTSTRTMWKQLEREGVPAAEAFVAKGRGMVIEQCREVFRLHGKGHEAVLYGLEVIERTNSIALRKHMRTINRLSGVAPLLGLLGTVSGMVHTFETITLFGFGNPVLLAEGISEALLTTQAGLVVAFPIVLVYNFILRRIERLEHHARAEALRLAAWMDAQGRAA